MNDAANFRFDHPLGPIYGWFSARGLRWLVLPPFDAPPNRFPLLHSSVNDMRVWILHAALERYFAGICQDFLDVPIDLGQGTSFHQSVWRTARNTQWGSTSTYGKLARQIGKPNAARAVGQALGKNPVPIIIPCHRFLAHDGALGGFSAGLEWKRLLLEAENVHLDTTETRVK